jgi:hypothetical protein
MFARIYKTKRLDTANTEYNNESAYGDDINRTNNGSNTDDVKSSIVNDNIDVEDCNRHNSARTDGTMMDNATDCYTTELNEFGQPIQRHTKALFGSSMVGTLTVNVPTIGFLPNTMSIVGTLFRRNIEKSMAH